MPIRRIQDEGRRPFIDQFDIHHRSEDPELDLNTSISERFDYSVEDRTGNFAGRRPREARPTPLTRVRVERELADKQHTAVNVEQRSIEPRVAVIPSEYSQVDRFVDQIVDVYLLVVVRNADENH